MFAPPRVRVVRTSVAFALSCSPLFVLVASAAQGAPRIDSLSPRGLQIGGVTRMVITGSDLLPAPQVWLGRTRLDVELDSESNPERVALTVALPSDAAPGIQLLRFANESGISNATAVSLDSLPQPDSMSDEISWPAAVTGTCEGSAVRALSIRGAAGQTISIEVEARRLGSALNPVVRIVDDRGTQLAWSQGQPTLGGDARMTATIPRDGQYGIELHDALFRASAPAHFRLKVMPGAEAGLVFPMGVQQGVQRAVRMTSATEAQIPFIPREDCPPASWQPVRTDPGSGVPSGSARIFVSPWTEVAEGEFSGDAAAPLPVPCGISGILGALREQDVFRVAAPAGTSLRVELWARRAGSPLDGVVTILAANGNVIASGDDQPDTVDPAVEFTIPEGMADVAIAVRDVQRKGGADYAYRLAVTQSSAPDIQVTADSDRVLPPRGGTALLRFHADRKNYDGPIALAMHALPAGYILENGEIPAGASDALVTVRATADAQPGVVCIAATAVDAGEPLVRGVAVPRNAVTRYSPWLGTEIAVAATNPAPIQVAWADSTSPGVLVLGGTRNDTIHVERVEGTTGAVRLALVTSQIPPTKNENNQTVPDVERTLRLAQEVTIPADQGNGQLQIAVPADLPATPFDVAVRSELLSADGAQVVSTSVTPSRRFEVVKPGFSIALAGPARLTAESDESIRVELKGSVSRQPEFTRAVTIKVEGLPGDLGVPSVAVPEGQSEFTLAWSLPTRLSLADLRSVKVAAVSELRTELFVPASNEIPLTLQFVAP